MAPTAQTAADTATTSNTDLRDHATGTTSETATSPGSQEGRPSMEKLCAEQLGDGGHADPQSPMGSPKEDASSHDKWSKTLPRGTTDAQTADELGTKGGHNPTIPCHAKCEFTDTAGAAMETTSQHPPWDQFHADAPAASRERSMAIPPLQTQAVESAALHSCSADPEEYAWGLPRQAIQTTILSLKTVNPHNQCWMNAGVQAMLWTTAASNEVKWKDFGKGANAVSRLLSTNTARGLDLLDWGFNPRDWKGDLQRDSSEYVAALLEHFDLPGYDHHWEKRIMVGEASETLLNSESNAPVILGLGAKSTSLQALIDEWCSAENTVVAFNQASTYKVFQLDRVTYTASGEPKKLHTSLIIEDTLLLPCFLDENYTHTELYSYVPVSVIFHSGETGEGHLQAGLRCDPKHWRSSNDNRIAVEEPKLLRKQANNIVMVWLIRDTSCGSLSAEPLMPGVDRMVNQIARHMCLGEMKKIQDNRQLLELLRARCIFCGQGAFRFHDLLAHQHEQHPELLAGAGLMDLHETTILGENAMDLLPLESALAMLATPLPGRNRGTTPTSALDATPLTPEATLAALLNGSTAEQSSPDSAADLLAGSLAGRPSMRLAAARLSGTMADSGRTEAAWHPSADDWLQDASQTTLHEQTSEPPSHSPEQSPTWACRLREPKRNKKG